MTSISELVELASRAPEPIGPSVDVEDVVAGDEEEPDSLIELDEFELKWFLSREPPLGGIDTAANQEDGTRDVGLAASVADASLTDGFVVSDSTAKAEPVDGQIEAVAALRRSRLATDI